MLAHKISTTNLSICISFIEQGDRIVAHLFSTLNLHNISGDQSIQDPTNLMNFKMREWSIIVRFAPLTIKVMGELSVMPFGWTA